jgi:hypothetical protein
MSNRNACGGCFFLTCLLFGGIIKYTQNLYYSSHHMVNPEKKTIEIKNATDAEIKDKLVQNNAPSLTDNTIQSFRDVFEKQLKPAGVDIFDNTNSKLIRQNDQLVIAKINADGTLTPKLIIDG